MAEGDKIRVALLYGGRSSEHDISLMSARSVLNHLNPERYEVVPIAVDREGRWHAQDYAMLMAPEQRAVPALPVETTGRPTALAAHPTGGALTGAQDAGDVGAIDVVLPIMHGPLCEDGALQGLCELADVAYVGSRVLGSAVSMDKDVAKRLVRSVGVPVADYTVVRAGQLDGPEDRDALLHDVQHRLGYPVFVKPANMGSSVGVSRARDRAQLLPAIEAALQYDTKVLIEEAIDAREIELAVLAPTRVGAAPEVSVPGEIEAADSFYSYDRKYLDADGAKLLIPAPLTEAQTERARQVARTCYEALECEGLSRIDLFLERDTGRFLFNESNTMPGFTTISMYAKMWAATGTPYGALLDRLIQDALDRHRLRSQLKHTR